jgi:hypothetical protein
MTEKGVNLNVGAPTYSSFIPDNHVRELQVLL